MRRRARLQNRVDAGDEVRGVGAGQCAHLEFEHGAVGHQVQGAAAMQRADMDAGPWRIERLVADRAQIVAERGEVAGDGGGGFHSIRRAVRQGGMPAAAQHRHPPRQLALVRISHAHAGRLADDAERRPRRQRRDGSHQIGAAGAADLLIIGEGQMHRHRAAPTPKIPGHKRARWRGTPSCRSPLAHRGGHRAVSR